MSFLFDHARPDARRHGWPQIGLCLSLALHAIVIIVAAAISMGRHQTPSTPRMRPIGAFVLPAAELVMLPSAPVAPHHTAPPAPPPARELASTEAHEPPPAVPADSGAVEPASSAVAPEPTSSLEQPVAEPAVQRLAEIGLFERTPSVRTSPTGEAVTTGGFGPAAASPRGTAARLDAVMTGAFSSAPPAPRGTESGSGEAQPAGFDRRPSAPARPLAAAPNGPVDRPVEIVFKPTPEYTDEARSARIEGTVSLELEFTAAGDVRVLRVVSGLGHGLDEAARQAALRIRFRPAQSDGRPVDSRATVHITFRLS